MLFIFPVFLQHLQAVPAVVVVFYDLDWDDPQWAERCGDLAAKIDVVRSFLQGRATKIGVVLVQKNAGLPGDQDLDQQQKAHLLCNRCSDWGICQGWQKARKFEKAQKCPGFLYTG